MEHIQAVRYFLGANSRRGFSSLYDGFVDPGGGDFLYVIKGGPGCGKSTLMKRVGKAAEDAGEPVEYVLCSGDPDSLDGVWLPARRTGFVDGTAPHETATKAHAAAAVFPVMKSLRCEAYKANVPLPKFALVGFYPRFPRNCPCIFPRSLVR